MNRIAPALIALIPHFQSVTVSQQTRDADWWAGAYRALRDLGIYLYTTEMNAINEYWFDVSGANHHPNFTRSTASMVWGGKTVGDGVWWTGNPEEVHGINWLPIQAGSLYLTQFPDYTRQNYEALVAENGGTNWNEWGDIIWMYRAIHNPADAINQMNAGIGSIFMERGNSRANVYHWIHNINALGTADRAVTADHPLYAVFNRQGARTYVAYNMSNAPITVSFSDGAVVNVPANAFSSGNGSGGGGDGGGGGDDDHGHTIAGGNVQFYVDDAPWADVHYIVNNGAQQNLRMTHSGGNNSYTLAGIPAGASVRYRFTIGLAAGGATETAWITFTMGEDGGGQDGGGAGASGHTPLVAPANCAGKGTTVARPAGSCGSGQVAMSETGSDSGRCRRLPPCSSVSGRAPAEAASRICSFSSR